MKPTKYADQVGDLLVELGFTHCFFVAGGNIMHLLDSARSRFTCIPVVHEVTAGIAAEYFNESDSNGKAFALVTAGPGVTNIITAMSGAWLESRELLVLAGQVKSSDLATGGVRQRGIQEVDGVGLTRATTKLSVQLSQPLPLTALEETIALSWIGRPGPVFVEFCLDVQAAPPVEDRTEPFLPNRPPTISNEELSSVWTALNSSERPLLLLGGGISRSTCRHLSDSLTNTGIPTMTTWNGADRIDSSSDVYVGRPNTWGQRAANLLTAQSDLIVAVGTRLGLQQTGFNWQEFGRGAKVIQIDIDPAELTKGHPEIETSFAVDADDFLARLIHHGDWSTFRGQWAPWLAYCHSVQTLLPIVPEENSTSEGFVDPYGFISELSELMNSHDIVVPCSSGGANSVTMQVLNQKRGQIVICNKGLASMGYGLGGAIGASLAHHGRRTILIEGDGGFAQNLQDLATVVVNRLPIKIFLFANNGYGSIRTTQKNYFGGAYLGCDTETGLGFPDWNLLFRAYGIQSVDIDARWTTNPDVLELFSSEDPVAFVVPIDPLQTYWPKITSRILANGSMQSNPLHEMSPPVSDAILNLVTKHL
jgi:acetolactate synthase I/II/III large subunit